MILLKPGQERLLEQFFPNPVDTTIWSYLQGWFGQGWVDSAEHPSCGRIIGGDFCFFGGDAAAPGAQELVRDFPANRAKQWVLAVPPDGKWAALLIAAHPEKHQKLTRYAIKKEPDCFDRAALQRYVDSLAPEFTLHRIDGELYHRCMAERFTHDFCSNFASQQDFLDRGIGFVALHDGNLAAGASSYTSYDSGIEIEIGTHPDYRRRGLATGCGARLILHCLDHGLYHAWDAANPESVALSEKLGYHFDYEYDAYFILWGEMPT